MTNHRSSLDDFLEEGFARATDHCPTLEELALVALEPGAADPHTVRHVEACPRCAAEVALADTFGDARRAVGASAAEERTVASLRGRLEGRLGAELHRGPDESGRTGSPAPPVGRTETPIWSQPAWLGAVAAACLLVLAGSLLVRFRPPVPDLPTRTTEPGQTVRGRTIEPLEPVGELDGAPTLFRWRDSAAPAPIVRLTVYGVDAVPIFSATTQATTYRPTDVERSLLRDAVRYRWRVEPVDDGSLASSITGEFTIRPAALRADTPAEGRP